MTPPTCQEESQPALEIRPLYIDGGAKVCVRLDGPSILVEHPDRSARRFPLQRVSRVLLSGHAVVEYQVIRACAATGIPFACLGADGAPQGFFLPWTMNRTRPAELLDDFLARPDWAMRWRTWQQAVQREVILEVLRACCLHTSNLRPDAAEAFVRQKLGLGAAGDKSLLAYQGLLAADVVESLLLAGLPPHVLSERRCGLQLAPGLVSILGWHHWVDISAYNRLGRDWRQIVTCYQQSRSRTIQRVRGLIDRFIQWLGAQRWE